MSSTPRISEDGTEVWYNGEGMIHRDDGPAYHIPEGVTAWYQYGLLHREDGPAVVYYEGLQYWYLNGVCYSFPEFVQQLFGDAPEATAFLLRWSE